jgi:acetyltransferase-like isoleucine patch superfamily enzyme
MIEELRDAQRILQEQKMSVYKRRVSFGDLVTDRWENARSYGFGDKTSCYDNVLIIGDVVVGSCTWIGPNVILDGSGGQLVIGDYCSISAGVQIYTHSTVAWSTSLGADPFEKKNTSIGNGVYIGPNSVISMGVTIGDKAIIGTMSFVNRDVPANTKAWGCPARIIDDASPAAPRP